MSTYRTNASGDWAVPPTAPASRARGLGIAFATVAAHAAFLTAAFVWRTPDPVAPRARVVTVLTGQVDPWTGDFHATGVRSARVRP